jgi:protein-L-isoaspartate(D-aspartate) O-methyltransferase
MPRAHRKIASPPAPDRLLRQIRPFVDDKRVLEAMRDVPREKFVPPEMAGEAWDNAPLPIGSGQTISQPLVVARMCELLELEGGERVLDVGTGSGYHAAVLARLCAHVWSIERHGELSEQAAENLRAAGVENVTLVVGDGARGLPAEAPFEAINVAAAALSCVPQALEDQLAPGGRLVAPVEDGDQRLFVVRRTGDDFTRTALERVRFVPLVT